MRRILLFILILLSQTSYAQTMVNGGNIGGLTFTKADSPYLILGDVLVQEGTRLTIEAGAKIEFQGHYSIRVEGDILANGTEIDTIEFDIKPSEIENGWNGIIYDTCENYSRFFTASF